MFPFKGADSVFVKVSFKLGDDKLLVEEWREPEQEKAQDYSDERLFSFIIFSRANRVTSCLNKTVILRYRNTPLKLRVPYYILRERRKAFEHME